ATFRGTSNVAAHPSRSGEPYKMMDAEVAARRSDGLGSCVCGDALAGRSSGTSEAVTGSTMSATGRMVATASTGSRPSVEQPVSAAISKQIGRRSAVRSIKPSLKYRLEIQLIE